MDNKERIRQLNDVLRTSGLGGKTLITPAVRALPPAERERLFSLVRAFNEFSTDNDPHNEHDFGIVKMNDGSYYWKVDYYDKTLTWGSEDPADPKQTARVMTIMHSYEY